MSSSHHHPTDLAARASAAADPHERLRAIAALRAELEDLETDAVRAALSAGSSWAAIARELGVTKQSAHRRLSKRLDRPPAVRRVAGRPPAVLAGAATGGPMLVTAQARRAVRAARAAARALDHAEVDPGHLLLGLMADPDGAAATALTQIGVDFAAARDAVGRLGLPATPAGEGGRRRIPISGATRAAFEQSLREAQRLGHGHLGVEHLLLALLRDDRSGAARALADVGISAGDLERCLGKVLKQAPFASR